MSSVDVEGIWRRLNDRRNETKRIFQGKMGRILDGVYDHAVVEARFLAQGHAPTKEELDAAIRHVESNRAGGLSARPIKQEQEECVAAPLPSPTGSATSVSKPQQPRAQFATSRPFSARQLDQFRPRPLPIRPITSGFTVLKQGGCPNRNPSPLSQNLLPDKRIPQIFPQSQQQQKPQVASVLNTPAGPVNIILNQNEPAHSEASVSMVGSIEPSNARACISTKPPLPGSTQVATNAPSVVQQPSGPSPVASSTGPRTINLIGSPQFISKFTSGLPVAHSNVTSASGPAPTFDSVVRSNTPASSSVSTAGASLKIINVPPGGNSTAQPVVVRLKDGRMFNINPISVRSSEPSAVSRQTFEGHSMVTQGSSQQAFNQQVNQRNHQDEQIQSQSAQNLIAPKQSGLIPLTVNKNRLNVGQNLIQSEPNPPIPNYGMHSPKPGPSNAIAPNVQLQLNIDTMQRPGQYSPVSPRRSDRIQKRASIPLMPSSTSWYEGSTPAKQVLTGSLPIEVNANQLSTQPSSPLKAPKSKYEEARIIVKQMVTKQVNCIIDNCEEVFKGQAQLEKHLKLVHKSGSIVCGAQGCGQTFDKSVKFTGHLHRVHRGVKSWPCTKCDVAPFESACNLNIHTKLEHQVGLFGCHFVRCGFTSELRKNVMEHVLNVHRNVAK